MKLKKKEKKSQCHETKLEKKEKKEKLNGRGKNKNERQNIKSVKNREDER